MLVLDNKEDQDFLEKVLVRLRYTVIAMRQGVDLSEQLIDHFPDVVFASTLGRNERILSALGKIKEIRGKPKLVFVRQEKESVNLSPEQKKIIDGVLYSPVDPFKLIDLLASTTEVPIVELRRRYNEMLEKEKAGAPVSKRNQSDTIEVKGDVSSKSETHKVSSSQEFGDTTVFGKGGAVSDDKIHVTGDTGSHPIAKESVRSKSSSSLIHDEKRKNKYAEWTKRAEKENAEFVKKTVDVEKLRASQKKQSEEIQEEPEVKENRKHFLKTMFSMNPADVQKKKKA